MQQLPDVQSILTMNYVTTAGCTININPENSIFAGFHPIPTLFFFAFQRISFRTRFLLINTAKCE